MKSYAAFSLIEILVALSIAAILIAIAFPSWHKTWLDSHHHILQEQLLRAIHLAHQEAQLRHQSIGLCKTKDKLQCSGDWSDGQLIFIDKNHNGQIQHKTQILTMMQMPSSSGKIHWRSFPIYRDYLQFHASPLVSQDNGTFWYCDTQTASPAWAIILSRSGRTRVIYPDHHGILKDGSGKLLSCDIK